MNGVRQTSPTPKMNRKPRQYRPLARKPDPSGTRLAWLGIFVFVLVALVRMPYFADGHRQPADPPATPAAGHLPAADSCPGEAAGRVAVEIKPATGDPAHVSG
ncbi:MAG: hypothetical protein PVJ78_03490 [Gammaproteobacteria bacterium]